VLDRDAREEAELHGLVGEREGAGDQRLRGDDGGRGREGDERVGEPALGDHGEEGVVGDGARGLGVRSLEQERALAEVVEQQRREHHGVPGEADRPRPKWPMSA
jgi:hypothetical protein